MPLIITRTIEVMSLDKKPVFPREEKKISEETAVDEILKSGASEEDRDDILDKFIKGHEYRLRLMGSTCYFLARWYWKGAKK